MLCNFFNRVLYISLPESTQRHDNIKFQFANSQLGSCLQRFNAVNGKNIDIRLISDKLLTEHGKKDILDGITKRFGITLSYGGLGCALSHYLIYDECKKANKPYLIFEDDIEIIDDFDNQLTNLIKDLETIDYDIVYLGLHNIPSLNKSDRISNMLYKPSGMTCGTYGMIVSNTGAEKILKMIFPISIQIDSEISNSKRYLKVYATNIDLVKHTHNFGSTIQREGGFSNKIQEMIL